MTSSFRALAAALLLASASVPLLAPAAQAELSKAQYEQNSITLTLSAERWVESSTARVLVSINAAVEGAQAGRVRSDMLAALNGLAAKDTAWRFVEFNRSADASGLERWYALVEARLPETALGGLGDMAKKASKPGLQLDLAGIDFSPTLAEIETARAELRATIYAQAVAEQKRLAAAVPGPAWRIATLTFNPEYSEPPAPQMVKSMAMRAESAPQADFGGGAISVATRLNLTAIVVLAAE